MLVCGFVQLRISLARIKLAASNFAQWFTSVLGRESPIMGNFAPPEAHKRANRTPPGSIAQGVYSYRTENVKLQMRRSCNIARHVDDVGRRVWMPPRNFTSIARMFQSCLSNLRWCFEYSLLVVDCSILFLRKIVARYWVRGRTSA